MIETINNLINTAALVAMFTGGLCIVLITLETIGIKTEWTEKINYYSLLTCIGIMITGVPLKMLMAFF